MLRLLNRDLKKVSLRSLAINIGLEQPTLWRLVNEKSHGSIATWEAIGLYYKKKYVE